MGPLNLSIRSTSIAWLVFCLLFYRCDVSVDKGDSTILKQNKFVNENNIISIIVGEWSLCEKIDRGESINFNVCPTIAFFNDHKGYYSKPSMERISFDWDLVNDSTLYINNSKNSIEIGKYRIIFTTKSDYTELQLNNSEINLQYFLGKSP